MCSVLRQHADSDVGVVAEYDLGERFDLKAKYADKGWVDEDAEFGKQACSLRQVVYTWRFLAQCPALV